MNSQQMVGALAVVFVHVDVSRLAKRMMQDGNLTRIIFNNKNTPSRNLFRLV